jgi:hypothetical protein
MKFTALNHSSYPNGLGTCIAFCKSELISPNGFNLKKYNFQFISIPFLLVLYGIYGVEWLQGRMLPTIQNNNNNNNPRLNYS